MNRSAAVLSFERSQMKALAHYGLEASSRFLDLPAPALRTHLLTMGGGSDPVLLVHGGNSMSASWFPLLPRLTREFRLHLPDRPGCGLTEPFDYRGVELRSHGANFLSGVLDTLGLTRASILANSMGGYFALSLALAQPERVTRLALLGEPAGSSAQAPKFHRLVGTRGLNTALYATALRPPRDAAGLRASWGKGHLVADPSRVPDALAECLAAGARIPGATRSWTTMVEQVFIPPGSGVRARAMNATHALLPELGRISCPTLFLWGSQDPFGTPDTGRILADRMPDARLQVIDDAGHLPWIDQPEECAEAVADFLGG